jgi:hypothetical protein
MKYPIIKLQAQISRAARAMLFVLLLVVFASLMAATLTLPKSVGWDPSYGILAAMQYEAGLAPDIRTIVTASAQDLTSLDDNQVTMWAPAYQAIPFALRSLGMTWGNAFRVLIASCLIVGSLGWLSYFRLFVKEKGALAILMLMMLCSAFTVDAATLYQGGDLLLWTTTPFLIVLNVLVIRSDKFVTGLALSFVGGFSATAIFAIKFSGIFLGIGLFVAWILEACRSFQNRRKFWVWCVGAASGIVFLFALNVIGGYTPVSRAGRKFDLIDGLAALGLWPTAMTDFETVLRSIWDKFGISSSTFGWSVSGAGWLLIIGIVLLAISQRAYLSSFLRRSEGSTRNVFPISMRAVLCVIAVDTSLYASTILLGSNVDVGARLARESGLLALPLVFILTTRSLSKSRGATFLLAAAMMAVLFIVPPLYGTVRFVKHIHEIYPVREKLTDSEDLLNQCFSFLDDARSFSSELRTHIPSKNTVLYTTYPNILFSFPSQRCLLIEAVEMFSAEQLRTTSYPRSPAEGVALFLPIYFEENGKLSAIQSSFRDIDSWEYVPMKSVPDWGLWISHKKPESLRRSDRSSGVWRYLVLAAMDRGQDRVPSLAMGAAVPDRGSSCSRVGNSGRR